MNSCHLGHDVWLIYYLPSDYNGYKSNGNIETFTAQLKKLKYKYIVAITTIYQEKSAEVLRDNNFKPIVIFKSAHNTPEENLTLWVRFDKNAPDCSNEEVNVDDFPFNCSVGFNEYYYQRCCLVAKKLVKLKGFKQISKLPLWYKINKKFIIKD